MMTTPTLLEALDAAIAAMDHATGTFERYANLHAMKRTDEGHAKSVANGMEALALKEASANLSRHAPQIKAMVEENERLRSVNEMIGGERDELLELRTTLVEENERLRAALREVDENTPTQGFVATLRARQVWKEPATFGDIQQALANIGDIARTALQEPTDGQ